MFIVTGKSRTSVCVYGPFETEEQAKYYVKHAYLNKDSKWDVGWLYAPQELVLFADNYNPQPTQRRN